jgi:hypothetical protein
MSETGEEVEDNSLAFDNDCEGNPNSLGGQVSLNARGNPKLIYRQREE